MGSYSKQYRATAAPSVGANWSNAANIYDTDANSYSERSTTSTSATHINGFGINLPSNAVVESVEVHTKAYLSNTRGYLYVYLYSDSGPTLVKSKQVANGASLSAQYVTQTYTADELIEVLTTKGLHGGSLVEFLKNARVRFVIGSTSSYLSSTGRIYDNYLVVNYKIPDYTLTVTAGVGGSVTGGGTYESGTTATLTATANTGYKFKQWSDGNTNATRTVTVTANATYTAQFEKTTCTVTAAASPAAGGTVTGGGTYESGTSVTLTAEPTVDAANGAVFQFKQWSDGDKSNPRTVTVMGDATYTAEFEQLYFCSAGASPEEGGTIAIDASDTSDMGEGWYPTGTVVAFTATANEGYKFVNWSTGDTSATLTVTVGASNAMYIAYFEKEETSSIFIGNQRVSAYLGTQKVSVYIGTQKLS